MKKSIIIAGLFLISSRSLIAQKIMGVQEIIQIIDSANPVSKMYDARIRSYDEAAKGARSWMPADLSTGLWMTPYNTKLWNKAQDGTPGMGQYMVSVQQMFPNKKKQDAEEAYQNSLSASDKERKKYELNQLHASAKKEFYDWAITKRKITLLRENEKMLELMIQDAEIRYRNSLDKISAYYKAKAALGNILNSLIIMGNENELHRIRLNILMNRDKLIVFLIDTAFQEKTFIPTLNAEDLQERSDIKALDKDMVSVKLQQVSERGKTKPEFGIRYDHMFGFGGFPMQYSLMGMAKISIGKANRLSKATAESLRWKWEDLTQQKQLLLNEATGMAAGTTQEIASKKKQVSLYEENILPAIRKNYQVVQAGYQQNTEQLPALFEAWDALNKTELEYLDQLQLLAEMEIELKRIFEK